MSRYYFFARRLVFLFIFIGLFSLSLSAQLPYMQFSHDTLGNRTGRVYGTAGGVLPLLSPDGTALQIRWWMDEEVDVFTGRNAFTQQTNDASYIKNGGQLVKVTIPKSTMYQLENDYLVTYNDGLHMLTNDLYTSAKSISEYCFMPSIKQTIVKLFQPY